MKGNRPPETGPTREEQVRRLGFDPRYLTPQEQMELLELQSLFSSSVLQTREGMTPERYS